MAWLRRLLVQLLRWAWQRTYPSEGILQQAGGCVAHGRVLLHVPPDNLLNVAAKKLFPRSDLKRTGAKNSFITQRYMYPLTSIKISGSIKII